MNHSKILNKTLDFTKPHDFLGLHDRNTIYQYSPNMKGNHLYIKGDKQQMELIDDRGIFVYHSEDNLSIKDYQVIHSDGTIGYDPYSCSSSIPIVDTYLFDQCSYYQLYDLLGSHRKIIDGIDGVVFSVYAPNAQRVYLRCDLGNWREEVYPMRKSVSGYIYELFIPGCREGMMYKYSIHSKNGDKLLKSDPFARQFEIRPNTASIVYFNKSFNWEDNQWLKKRKEDSDYKPVNVYELHLGAWYKDSRFPNYREIAHDIVHFVREMGYTHIELMPITEHPLDESWGYQVSGYFSATSRYGNLHDFKYFVNYLHVHNIGVIFDFVSAHFPKDESFLSKFDGNHLFENSHPVMGEHPEWGTLIFDYGSQYVRNFLISSLLFWIRELHIDMIRVDAVHSILYLNYQRIEGQYEKNIFGGVENIEGIAFLQQLNSVINNMHPDVSVIAEDSSIFDGITNAVDDDGMGFSMKWNIGWYSDLSRYLSLSDQEKQHQHKFLLNSYKEVFREKYILSISHDEVSKGKKSLFNKFSDVEEEKFAFLRLLYSVAITHPGKKLFFMGHEIGTKEEFCEKKGLDHSLYKDHSHIKHKLFTRDMNFLYLENPALYEIDFDEKGFAWIDYSDYTNSVISFVRKGITDRLLVIHNFSRKDLKDYFLKIPDLISIEEIMNTDDSKYGGEGQNNSKIKLCSNSTGIYLNIARISTVICRVVTNGKNCCF